MPGHTSEPQDWQVAGQETRSEVAARGEGLSMSLLQPQFSSWSAGRSHLSPRPGSGAEQPGSPTEACSALSPALAQGQSAWR